MPTTQEQVALLTDQIARLVALTGAILKGAVPLWVSGGSYVTGQIRQSPADQLYYQANTTHSGLTADPSTDAVNWRSFLLDGFAPVSHQHVKADITDFDEADYATGAEGDLAATAVQPAALADYLPLAGGTATGDVGLGTSNAGVGVGNIETGVYLLIGGRVSASANAAAALRLNRNSSDGPIAAFYRDGVSEGSISITTTATSYNTTSDERVKQNIVAAGDPGALIDAVQVRAFDMPHTEGVDHYDFGFVAQELYPIFPQAVTVGETDDDLWSVDHSKLVPLMMREIQSLRQRVADLEAGA